MELSINVDIGIGKCLDIVNDYLLYKRNQQEYFINDLIIDLDVAFEIIKTLDNIFIDLVRGFANKDIIEDIILLEDLVKETYKYLERRDLLPILQKCIGSIRSTGFNDKLKKKRYREMVLALRTLAKRLEEYRNNLSTGIMTGVGQVEDINLQTLCELVEKCNYGGGTMNLTIDEMAEELFRNHDFDLSDSIHSLIGKARSHAKLTLL